MITRQESTDAVDMKKGLEETFSSSVELMEDLTEAAAAPAANDAETPPRRRVVGLGLACGMVMKDAMAVIVFLLFVTVVPFSFITAGALVVMAAAKAFRRGGVSSGLSEREMEAIPKEIYGEEQRTDGDCAVCLVDFEVGEEIRRLGCGHCYHGECIGEWLRRRAVCPKCAGKVVVTARRRRRIF